MLNVDCCSQRSRLDVGGSFRYRKFARVRVMVRLGVRVKVSVNSFRDSFFLGITTRT